MLAEQVQQDERAEEQVQQAVRVEEQAALAEPRLHVKDLVAERRAEAEEGWPKAGPWKVLTERQLCQHGVLSSAAAFQKPKQRT